MELEGKLLAILLPALVGLVSFAMIFNEADATICPLDMFQGHAETILDSIKNQDYAEATEQAELILELTGKAEEEKD